MGPRSQARADINAVAQQIQQDWTAYDLKVEIDNRDLVDYANQKEPFLQIQVLNLGGEQAELGEDPFTCQEGQILLSAVARAGDGTAKAAELLDFAQSYFHLKRFTLVRCEAAVATKPREVREWWHESAIIPFWYHWK